MNSYVVDSKISRLSDSDFHTAVYLGHSNFSPHMTQVPQKSTWTKKGRNTGIARKTQRRDRQTRNDYYKIKGRNK